MHVKIHSCSYSPFALSPSVKNARAFTYVSDDVSHLLDIFFLVRVQFFNRPDRAQMFFRNEISRGYYVRLTGLSTLERFPPSNPLFPALFVRRPGRYGALSHRERPSIPDSSARRSSVSPLRASTERLARVPFCFLVPLLFLARIPYRSLARNAIFPDLPTSRAGRF